MLAGVPPGPQGGGDRRERAALPRGGLGSAPPRRRTPTSLTDQMWSIPVDRITLDGVEQVREKLAAWQSAARRGPARVLRAGHLREPEGSRPSASISSR